MRERGGGVEMRELWLGYHCCCCCCWLGEEREGREVEWGDWRGGEDDRAGEVAYPLILLINTWFAWLH